MSRGGKEEEEAREREERSEEKRQKTWQHRLSRRKRLTLLPSLEAQGGKWIWLGLFSFLYSSARSSSFFLFTYSSL